MRGFPDTEYAARLHAAQRHMTEAGLGAVLLTIDTDIRYFRGFLTRFWESPSRPWFLVLPQAGRPIAVIPSIGAALMGQTWVKDIRTWSAPDPEDDGVSLLADTLREVGGPVGLPHGRESYLRMPLGDFDLLKAASGLTFTDDHGIVAALREVKSEAEIDKITVSCKIAERAFDRVPEIARAGVTLDQVFRDFQRLLLEEGAEWVPYLAGGAGQAGYGDVISPATSAPLAEGDILMLDTGVIRDGYFCDYNRNFAVGPPAADAAAAHARLIEATAAGFEAARPGITASELFRVMADITGGGETAGRLGHGLGLQLTEGLSLSAKDHSVLQAGMVITLEPGIDIAPGRMLVH